MMFQNFSSLPNEILLTIAENLGERDLKHLLEASGSLYLLLTPLMHKAALQDKSGGPALHWGSLLGHESLVRVVLDAGININSLCSAGLTALHYAVLQGHINIVEVLLSKGADVHLEAPTGETVLHLAVGAGSQCFVDSAQNFSNKTKHRYYRQNEKCYEKVVRILLDHHADVDHRCSKRSALHVAVLMQSKRMVQLLLMGGADANVVDFKGMTPLILAALSSYHGTVEIVKILLENGSNITASSRLGNTALHFAVGVGTKKVVQLLLENGADLSARNIFGETAVDYAMSRPGGATGVSSETFKLHIDRKLGRWTPSK